ncbi:MAG: hypothetical protein WD972_00995 [Candidatus Andersenbacteria bacterium]
MTRLETPLIDLQGTYPNLRKAISGVRHWKLESIREGLQYFYDTHGRYPTAHEIDAFEFLPSSRSIQRTFGGLEKLRTVLGLKDTHFGKNEFRSQIAEKVGKRGREVELALEKVLREKFGEVFVHTEKIFDDTKCRVDFYVYSPSGNFGADVFYTESKYTLRVNINMKEPKYKNFTDDLYLVVANETFIQSELDQYMRLKRNPLPKNITIVTLLTFLQFIETKSIYSHLESYTCPHCGSGLTTKTIEKSG